MKLVYGICTKIGMVKHDVDFLLCWECRVWSWFVSNVSNSISLQKDLFNSTRTQSIIAVVVGNK